ncbi:MAG: hypothetical protein ACTHN5_04455 [Phycisphaerae bacterium]
MILRHSLALAVLSAALIGVGGCDHSTSESSEAPTNGTPNASTPNPTDSAANNQSTENGQTANGAAAAGNNTEAGGNTMGAGNATTQPGASSASNMPGLPSVNGTSVKGLSTADAAATRLIDEAKNAMAKGDTSKVKTLVGELKQKGMYDSLSAPVKSQVDELAMQAQSAAPTTQAQ